LIANTLGAETGYFGGVSEGALPEWIYQYDPAASYSVISSLVASNQSGGWRAASFYARMSDAIAGGQNTIEAMVDLCDVDTDVSGSYPAGNSWCRYEQGKLTSTVVGYHLNEESDLQSTWTVANSNPFNYNPLGHTSIKRLGAGDGTHASQNISSFAELINNGAAAETGIIIGQGSLDTSPTQPSFQHVAPIIASYPSTGYEWDSANGTMAVQIYEYTGASNWPVLAYNLGANGHIEHQLLNTTYLAENSTVMYPVTANTYSLGASAYPFASVYSTAYYAGATAGVSCSRTPTSSFASINGIVTHC
jgi:hypothetical protein